MTSLQDPCSLHIIVATVDEQLFKAICHKHKPSYHWDNNIDGGKLRELHIHQANYGELVHFMDVAEDEDCPPFKYQATAGVSYASFVGIAIGGYHIFIPASSDFIPTVEIPAIPYAIYDNLAKIEFYHELDREFQVYTQLLV